MTHPRIADIWGPTTAFSAGEAWPARVDTHLVAGVGEGDVDRWVPSACLLCSNGCGVDIAVSGGHMVGVRGREVDRVNHGRLGPKGLFGWQGHRGTGSSTRWCVVAGGWWRRAGTRRWASWCAVRATCSTPRGRSRTRSTPAAS